ncbi:MAG: GFA family protein [bacterium]
MSSMLRGACLCGPVRLEITGEPQAMNHCHGGICRKASGAAAATNLIVAHADFRLVAGAEQLASYASSPNKRRCFCGACGSPIDSHGEATRDIVSLRVGRLDDDPPLRPSLHLHVDSKAAWDDIGDTLPQLLGGLG